MVWPLPNPCPPLLSAQGNQVSVCDQKAQLAACRFCSDTCLMVEPWNPIRDKQKYMLTMALTTGLKLHF